MADHDYRRITRPTGAPTDLFQFEPHNRGAGGIGMVLYSQIVALETVTPERTQIFLASGACFEAADPIGLVYGAWTLWLQLAHKGETT